MAVRASAPGFVASKFSKMLTPIEDSIEFFGLYTEDVIQDAPRRIGMNLASYKRDGIVVGTPTQHGDGKSVVFKALSNFVQSRWQETAAQSHIIVAASDATMADNANRPQFFGTATGIPTTGGVTTTFGTRLYVSAAGAVRYAAGRGTSTSDDVQGDAAVVVSDHTAYVLFLALTPGGTGDNTIKNLSTGTTASSAVNLPRFYTINRMRYGSGYATQEGTCHIHSVISSSKLWDTDEQARATDFMRELAAGYSITV